LSISVPAEVEQAIRTAAGAAGLPVSVWLVRAAERAAARRGTRPSCLLPADRQAVRQSWLGRAVSPDGRQGWWSGGGGDLVHAFEVEGAHLKRTRAPEPPGRRERPGREGSRHFHGGIAFDRTVESHQLCPKHPSIHSAVRVAPS